MRFKINIDEINAQEENSTIRAKCLELRDFKQNYVTWNIIVCRKHEVVSNDADKLEVLLESVFAGETAEWTCETEGNVKLLPTKEGVDLIEKKIPSHNFKRKSPLKGVGDIIQWKDLIKNYTINNEATIELRVVSKELNRTPVLNQVSENFCMSIKMDNIHDGHYTNSVVLHGIKWRLFTVKINDSLAAFIDANEDDMDVHKSWNVNAEFQVISTNKETKPVIKRFKNVAFNWTNSIWGFRNLIKWNELTDKNFITNGAVHLCIELIVFKSDSKL